MRQFGMTQEWKVVEKHIGTQHNESRIVAVCESRLEARRLLSEAFDDRWNAHVFPEEVWVSECQPPESSPDSAWFSSKYPDEGEFCFSIIPVYLDQMRAGWHDR